MSVCTCPAKVLGFILVLKIYMLLFTERQKAKSEMWKFASFSIHHVCRVMFLKHRAIFTEIKIFADAHQSSTVFFFLPRLSHFSSRRNPPFTAGQK